MNNKHIIDSIITEAEKTIYGKRKTIELTLASLLAGGHVLFDDIPGVGKTLLVRTFAKILDLSFSRVQFTPDLMPSDILGVTIYNKNENTFTFTKGPIFSDILMADEINRTSPKTQSALLEAMSENQVTIDGNTYKMSPNFFVLATQNPLRFEGTHALPEAQLDRFIMKLSIGYPEYEDELKLIATKDHELSIDSVSSVLDIKTLNELKEAVNNVYIHDELLNYALKLARATRYHPDIVLGISPRGTQLFIKAAKAMAIINGRDYCVPEDFIEVMEPVFSHRIQRISTDIPMERIIEAVQKAVKAPTTF